MSMMPKKSKGEERIEMIQVIVLYLCKRKLGITFKIGKRIHQFSLKILPD